MNIKELEKIMVEHGVVLRAIPKRIEKIYETEHLHMYPDAKIEYSDIYKKDMLIVETFPEIGGKFIFVEEETTASWVHFSADNCYDTIEEAINGLLAEKNLPPIPKPKVKVQLLVMHLDGREVLRMENQKYSERELDQIRHVVAWGLGVKDDVVKVTFEEVEVDEGNQWNIQALYNHGV